MLFKMVITTFDEASIEKSLLAFFLRTSTFQSMLGLDSCLRTNTPDWIDSGPSLEYMFIHMVLVTCP